MNSVSAASATASLDDPSYYLTNFRFVLAWVSERHHDLLDSAERTFLSHFDSLPRASQALLVRMVMRKGELFRLSKLNYPEIGDSAAAIAPLVELGWIDDAPRLALSDLFRLLRLVEVRQALASDIAALGLAPSTRKAALLDALAVQRCGDATLSQWWPAATDSIVRLTVMATCDRLRLMFFGNLRQDWAEFVLTELGLQRFESVPLNAQSRAFQARDEVDGYLTLQRLRERLDEGEEPAALYQQMPLSLPNRWLTARRSRLLFTMGREAERSGQAELALTLYRDADSSDARIRQLRVLERQCHYQAAYDLTCHALTMAPSEGEAQALARLLPRLERRLGLTSVAASKPPETRLRTLALPGPQPVERAVVEHLSTSQAPVYYVENTLLSGLFGLLCWPAIFMPLPGAFFHPFHSGPADLHRTDFVRQRQAEFDACLARLDDGSYRETMRTTWQAKQGITTPFVHWGLLGEELLELALECLPAAHLRACFERFLDDLKANRAGLPDLIQLFPGAPPGEPRYRMIEVKGPGDRLQDNQRRWLAFFHRHHMPVEVCHVRWQTSAAGDA